jgi:hypothetical protein
LKGTGALRECGGKAWQSYNIKRDNRFFENGKKGKAVPLQA